MITIYSQEEIYFHDIELVNSTYYVKVNVLLILV